MQDRDRSLLDELDHSVRHRFGLAVEANNEACVYKKTGSVNLVDAVRNAPSCVLLLPHRHQRRSIRTLDADKDADEISAVQQRQELGIVGEIERCLRGELEWVVVGLELIG